MCVCVCGAVVMMVYGTVFIPHMATTSGRRDSRNNDRVEGVRFTQGTGTSSSCKWSVCAFFEEGA